MKQRNYILLIRHARTKGNEEKRYIGCKSDESLSEDGRKELEQVTAHMRIDRVFSSPMRRCVMTAEALFAEQDIEIAEGLTEMDFGQYEGMNYEELKGDSYYQSWIDSGGMLAFPGGEDVADFTRRTMKAFSDILQRLRDGESAAIVCHGGNIMAIMSALTGGSYFDYSVKNLEGYAMQITNDGQRIEAVSHERFGIRKM